MFFFINKTLYRLFEQTTAVFCCVHLFYFIYGNEQSTVKDNSQPYKQVCHDLAALEGGSLETCTPDNSTPAAEELKPAQQNQEVLPNHSVIRSKKKVQFTAEVEEFLGFAYHKSDYDRSAIETEKPKETEDVLTWISSALQNNNNELSQEETQFFIHNILPLYATNFTSYQSSLKECVLQFSLRTTAIKDKSMVKLGEQRDFHTNVESATSKDAGYCMSIISVLDEHIHELAAIAPFDGRKIHVSEQLPYFHNCTESQFQQSIAVH
jgi:hypothetical protein